MDHFGKRVCKGHPPRAVQVVAENILHSLVCLELCSARQKLQGKK
jgi:hypothetical protein